MLPETSRWNPVGNQSHSIELGQQSKASLASALVTASAKMYRWLSMGVGRDDANFFGIGGSFRRIVSVSTNRSQSQ